MRCVPIGVLLVLVSGVAVAQTAASPTVDGISRDDYIAKVRADAEKRAATRFDAMGANHDGVLTKAEIAAYRAAHRRKPEESSQ